MASRLLKTSPLGLTLAQNGVWIMRYRRHNFPGVTEFLQSIGFAKSLEFLSVGFVANPADAYKSDNPLNRFYFSAKLRWR